MNKESLIALFTHILIISFAYLIYFVYSCQYKLRDYYIADWN